MIPFNTVVCIAKTRLWLTLPAVLFLMNMTLSHFANAQIQGVRIGITPATTPDQSAMLDIVASNKGILIPRLDSVQRVQISSPAQGLMVYQKDGQQGFWYYQAPAGWIFLKPVSADNLGNHTATTALNLQGNALTGTGSNITGVGIGITANGGLNIGQNTVGSSIHIGYAAGRVSTGNNNQIIGFESGFNNTTGSLNHFNGYRSGYANTTGNNNQFSGYQSGFLNTTGARNNFNGYLSGYSNTTGYNNQFSGYLSGNLNTTGSLNHFNGYRSGYANTTGTSNYFSGYGSGFNNTSGSLNHFNGFLSGFNNNTGINNHFSGYQSGYTNTTGSRNWAFGYNAGPTAGNLEKSGAIGYNAQVSQSNSIVIGGTGADAVNVGIGTTAPSQKLDVAGVVHSSTGGFMFPDGTTQTTAAAADNLGNHTATTALNLQGNAITGTGSNITGVGIGVTAAGGLNIGQNTTGNNIFIGYQAGRVTTGTGNQFTGFQSGYHNTIGNFNQFSGFYTGYSNTTGSNNYFSGYQSGYSNTTGSKNYFSGFYSGSSNTTGSDNYFSGYLSGYSNTSGFNNHFSGYQSGSNNTIGGRNWAFGYNSGPTAGNLEKSGAIGYNAKVSQSNSIVIGGTGADAVNVGIGTTAPAYKLDVAGDIRANSTVYTSDARFKEQVQSLSGALASVQAIRGVRYQWNKLGVAQGGKAGVNQIGFLAQELEKIYPELVTTDKEGYKAVNYAQLTPVLLEAIKEQHLQIETLKAQQHSQEAKANQTSAELQLLYEKVARLLGEVPAGNQARK